MNLRCAKLLQKLEFDLYVYKQCKKITKYINGKI